jgi:hypothetical protein
MGVLNGPNIKDITIEGKKYFVLMVHPDVVEWLKPTPKEKWKMEYSLERAKRRKERNGCSRRSEQPDPKG